MGDLAAIADTKSVNGQGDKEISEKNYIENVEEKQYGNLWGLSHSPTEGYLKKHSGDDGSHFDTADRSQKRTAKKSSIFKEFVEASSPILSPLLSQVKEKQATDSITFSEASVNQLVSETDCLSKECQSPEKSIKEPRPNDNKTSVNPKQKTSPTDPNKRRKIKNEDEKKTPKQIKDEVNRSAKGACPQCGMANADGLKTICKSCINLRKENKSKDNQNIKKKRFKLATDSQPKAETPPAIKAEQTDETKHTEEESANKSRSMSLDLNEIAETLTFPSKKFYPPKRTSTDLGQTSTVDLYNSTPTTKPTRVTSSEGLDNRLSEDYRGLNDIAFTKANFNVDQKKDEQTSQEIKVDTKHRLMKRSTTDSEIVSKVKSNANIGKENDRKNSADSKSISVNKKQDSTKVLHGTRENSGSSVKSESPGTNKEPAVSFRMERSKTILGKVSFESEKKPQLEHTEGMKTKELSSNSLDNDRSTETKSKKLSMRSHTIIGDGLAKRLKQKPDAAKPKFNKREGSSVNVKKKQEGKNSGDAEDEKKLSPPEEEASKKKLISNIMPKTLYDCTNEDCSSESEDEDEDSVEDASIAVIESKEEIVSKTPARSVKGLEGKLENLVMRPKTPVPDTLSRAKIPDYVNAPREPATRLETDRSHYDTESDDDEDEEEEMVEMEEEDMLALYGAYTLDDDDNELNSYRVTGTHSYGSHCSSNEQLYSVLEKINEESEESDDEDVYQPSKEIWYHADVSNAISMHSSDRKITANVAKNDSYFEIYNSYGREAKHEEIELSYSDYHPYTISRSVKAVEDLADYTSMRGKEIAPAYTEISYTGPLAQQPPHKGDNDKSYFGIETDVDTGLAVPCKMTENAYNSYTFATRNEWGFFNTDDNSSSSSDESDEDEGDDDAWYTGGFYTSKSKSNTSEKNDDLVYYNDKAGAQLSDSDIYTGELFSNVESNFFEIKDISRNNNVSLEENILARSKIWYNISSRPQMHPAITETVINTGVNEEGILFPFCNMSNNGIYDEDGDYISTRDTCNEEKKVKQMVLARSDYTEYANFVHQMKPKKDLILFGKSDFSKYDNPKCDEKTRDEDPIIGRGESDKVELMFFGEQQQRAKPKPYVATNYSEKNLYFNKKLAENMNFERHYDHEHEHKLDREDLYQGGFFYASRYGYNNNSNNGTGAESSNEHYTGCFRNEEEYKPTFEGLFNDKPTSFNFQKRRPDVDNLYFAGSNSKSYYDIEDSIYAFDKKEKLIKKKPERPPVVKIGGITVRNNVECEVDYAQNINMDLQMTTWKRYDTVGEDEAPETEGSNYAKNILFEEMVGGKPWVMDECRTPWKVPKPASNVPGKNKSETKWKAPDKVVKSVKTLGTYVTKWF